MEVILLERVEKLGQMGDVVNVRPGYARNYLLPQKKALRATEENRASFEDRRAHLEAENLENRAEAERVAEKLEDFSVVIVRQASDNDHLYGSVTTRDIAGAVSDAGVTVDRRQIQLDRPIKTVGLHQVRVRLHPEVAVEVTTNVARSEEEAEMQARGESVRADQDAEDDDGEAAPLPEEDDAAPRPEADDGAGLPEDAADDA